MNYFVFNLVFSQKFTNLPYICPNINKKVLTTSLTLGDVQVLHNHLEVDEGQAKVLQLITIFR